MWNSVQTYPSFLATVSHSVIPETLKKSLFDSIHSTADKRNLVAEDLAPLRHGPTLLQFTNEIKLSSSTSAPGRSGLSYKMLKHQSPLIIAKLYDILLDSWKAGRTPSQLNFKLLYMLPKKPGDNSLSNIRPIVLIETLRKIWVGCIVRQVRFSWEKHSILHPTQYGFRARRSCSSCLVQLINLTESAREHNHPLFFSSWDLRKAFDSVPRPVIQLALCRLGVPMHLANYLAYIDVGDLIQPCSPHAASNHDAPCFTTLRGTGQGDKGSPSIWVAVMDMILCAVDTIPSDLHFQGSNGIVHTAKDLAYADDFVSFSRTHESLQQKANIFAATAALLGLEIATDKFRTGVINSECRSHPPLTVHSSSWIPIRISYALTHITLKYLGSNQDMHSSTSSELKRLKLVIKDTIQLLKFKIGSSKSKIRYIQGALFPRISYPASFTSCSLSELQQLDQVMRMHLKSLSNVAAAWPNKLLYAEGRDGGLGLPKLSDYIQSVKLNIMQRSLLADPFTRNAMDAMLNRQCPNPHVFPHRQVSHSTGTWSSSLATYLNEENLHIFSSGTLSRNHLDNPIRDYFPDLPPSILNTVGDITEWHDGIPSLIPLSTIRQAGIDTGSASWSPLSVNEKINDVVILPTTARQMIYPGQHWLLRFNNRQPTIITITGWSSQSVMGWLWSSTSGSLRLTKSFQLTRTNHIDIPWDTFAPTHRVILSTPTRDHLSLTSNTLLFIHAQPSPRPLQGISPPFPEASLLHPNQAICTDGSWNKIYHGPFESQAVITTGASVAIMDNNFSHGLVIQNHLADSSERAFSQEAIALVVGLSIHRYNQLTNPVYSDCKSLVKLINSSAPLPQKATNQLVHLSRLLSRDNFCVQWVPAHLEQSADQPIHEVGNAFADKIADLRHTDNVTTLSPSTLLNIAQWTNHWFIGNADGPALLNINRQRNARIASEYYTNRTNDHPLSPPQQSVLDLIRIHKAFSAGQRGALIKLILSKFDDDRILQQWQQDNLLPSPLYCSCGCCNTIASWTSTCSDPEVTEHRHETLYELHSLLQHHLQLREYIFNVLFTNPEPIWRGIWSLHQMNDITAIMSASPLSEDNWNLGKKLMDKITLIITSGALSMHSKHSTSRSRYKSSSSRAIPAPLPTAIAIDVDPSPPRGIRLYLHPSHVPAHINPTSPATPATYRPTNKDTRNKQAIEDSKTPSIRDIFPNVNGIHRTSSSGGKLTRIHINNKTRLAHLDTFFPVQVQSRSRPRTTSTAVASHSLPYTAQLPCTQSQCMSPNTLCMNDNNSQHAYTTTATVTATVTQRANMISNLPSPGHSAPRMMDTSITRQAPFPNIPIVDSTFHPSIT